MHSGNPVARLRPVRAERAPPTRRRDQDDRRLPRAGLGNFEGPVDYEVVDQHELVGDDVAVTYSLSRISYTVAGERTDLWFRKTLALAKVDGTWLIVHEHESVPMADEGRAATDLLP